VKDAAGKTASTSKTVTVSAPNPTLTPVASLAVTPQTGTAPLYVTADSSGSYETGGSIASRTINFGDGTIATTTTATHTYSVAGTFTVTLTVKDAAGKTASTSKTVTASAPAPSGGCTVNTTNRTVTICSLTPGSTVTSPVTINAKATDNNKVQAMSIYVDGKKVYTKSQTSSIDKVIPMASGYRRVTVQAKDATGYFQSSVYITLK
jgi:PKD repeat protein